MADDDDVNKHEWEKPAWAKDGPKLRSTGKADAMKTSGNLAKEITHVNAHKDESRDTNKAANAGLLKSKAGDNEKDLSWEKPAWTQNAGLKGKSDTGEKDVSWEKPAWTQNAGLKGKSDTGEKDVSWEKPAWASNAGLKETNKGKKLAEKGDLAKPITFPKGK